MASASASVSVWMGLESDWEKLNPDKVGRNHFAEKNEKIDFFSFFSCLQLLHSTSNPGNRHSSPKMKELPPTFLLLHPEEPSSVEWLESCLARKRAWVQTQLFSFGRLSLRGFCGKTSTVTTLPYTNFETKDLNSLLSIPTHTRGQMELKTHCLMKDNIRRAACATS